MEMHSGIPSPAGVKSRQQPGDDVSNNHPESYSPSQKSLARSNKKKKKSLKHFQTPRGRDGKASGEQDTSSGVCLEMCHLLLKAGSWTLKIPAQTSPFLTQGTLGGPAGKTLIFHCMNCEQEPAG